ncbi:MAG: hypothetical protein R6W68_15475 [Ignavibacteriaceae bacterium]
MNKIFKILYFFNLFLLLVGLFSPIVKYFTYDNSQYDILYEYWLISMLTSITVCIPFFLLSIYGMIKYKQYITSFLIATILVSIWMVTGIYQLIYAYNKEIF